jgi:hypothetical protein
MADITAGAQIVSATGPVPGTLNISALSTTPTLKLGIQSLSAGATARIAIEDTTSATAFPDAQQAAVFDVKGPVGTAEGDTGPHIELSVISPACFRQEDVSVIINLTQSTIVVA